ncbi:MAG: hypothetical protein GY810_27210 [Aureispira sp.]|nr:hypothetical protein [Aureispira sp.]
MGATIDMGFLLEQKYPKAYREKFRLKLELINQTLEQHHYPRHKELEESEHLDSMGCGLGSYSSLCRRLIRLRKFATFIALEQTLPTSIQVLEEYGGLITETAKLKVSKDSIRHFEQIRHLLAFGMETVYVPLKFDEVFNLSLANGTKFKIASGVWVAKICNSLCDLMNLEESSFWTYQDLFEKQEEEPFAGYSYFTTEFPQFDEWGYDISNSIRSCAEAGIEYSAVFIAS